MFGKFSYSRKYSLPIKIYKKKKNNNNGLCISKYTTHYYYLLVNHLFL